MEDLPLTNALIALGGANVRNKQFEFVCLVLNNKRVITTIYPYHQPSGGGSFVKGFLGGVCPDIRNSAAAADVSA